MLTREELEKREDSSLAPYAMKSMHTHGRVHPEDEHPYRSVYQRDRDRIIHSTAFRRLEYKTQVFVNHEGDYYRTRLTHSIEVAQIARSISRALCLNEDLSEAIALAHDLGHTPFGHSGEDALRILMRDHGGFEHNVQGLRVVDILEKRYSQFSGLNLSWEVRESIAKHKLLSDDPNVIKFDLSKQPLLEAKIVDIADSIAYDNHDIDDSLKAELITESGLEEVELWRYAKEKVGEQYNNLTKEMENIHTIKYLIDMEVTDLITHTQQMIEKMKIETTDDVQKCKERLVSFSPDISKKKLELQEFLQENAYNHYRVVRMADKAKRFVEELFNAFIENPMQLPPEYQKWIEEAGLYQGVCDYIAGMTDRFAQDEYLKLFYPYERV
ncbi:deoxyguanosinetriphosphate triphosphohydrolase [Candidatus Scalindua japonica]|uniref:Deoxyguanosinetriphosphate triphosphohydrolase-like protein n=1 Tax=Candidatus Scalindua japonica TaxID=1284222 RepID=A0A286U0V0_9BACT|nr:deoxyguanosinetriphosphate triphosphohydrolase [Candidatus Scalindua japonica]GAX61779.1 deoxyguanosinetriphosphate triphosphohydrolase [Candidatus Scalindua japonica]